VTACGIIIGVAIDYLGVRKSLILGSLLSFLGRVVIALSNSRALLMTMLFSIIPIGSSLGKPSYGAECICAGCLKSKVIRRANAPSVHRMW
jgi:dipeptide/tripeptide permease